MVHAQHMVNNTDHTFHNKEMIDHFLILKVVQKLSLYDDMKNETRGKSYTVHGICNIHKSRLNHYLILSQ